MNDEDKARGYFRKPRESGKVVNTADWESCDAKVIIKVIALAARKGGALRFGYTRDGGAYALGIYAGSNYFTDYIRPGEDIDGYLADLLSSFEDYEQSDGEAPRKVKPARK